MIVAWTRKGAVFAFPAVVVAEDWLQVRSLWSWISWIACANLLLQHRFAADCRLLLQLPIVIGILAPVGAEPARPPPPGRLLEGEAIIQALVIHQRSILLSRFD
jgi:hypothetical protein